MNSSNHKSWYIAQGAPSIPKPSSEEAGPSASSISTDTLENGGNTPVAPLPNPGEGGPVDPGPAIPTPPGADVPVVPLPNPGEGGPVDPGPVIPTPPGADIPVVPLPNPGEGGPVDPGPAIPIYPQPNPPCFYCDSSQVGKIRFMNAAYDYGPFRVYVNRRFIAGELGFGSITPYGRVSSGYQTVTVTGNDGYIYLQKPMPINAGDLATIAIIRRAGGLDLLKISDLTCNAAGTSCLRASNLAYDSGPLDLVLYDGRVVFSDIRYKETTMFKRIRPGEYQFYLAETSMTPMPYSETLTPQTAGTVISPLPEVLVSFYVDVNPDASYTIFILKRGPSPQEIQIMTVEDR